MIHRYWYDPRATRPGSRAVRLLVTADYSHAGGSDRRGERGRCEYLVRYRGWPEPEWELDRNMAWRDSLLWPPSTMTLSSQHAEAISAEVHCERPVRSACATCSLVMRERPALMDMHDTWASSMNRSFPRSDSRAAVSRSSRSLADQRTVPRRPRRCEPKIARCS